MSQENVELVRRFYEPIQGENWCLRLQEAVERVGPDPQTEAVVAFWAEDPAWQHVHPDVRPTEYRDLGDWVLVETEARAQGPGRHPSRNAGLRALPSPRRQDRRVPVVGSEQEGLEAAGLEE